MDELVDLVRKVKYIFICGNGGSASTAEHLTTDLIKKRIPAICLNSNVSVITMIANDYGYEQIFSKQLEIYCSYGYPKENLLITISCSGTSPNIVNAIKTAKELDMEIYEFEIFNKDKDYGKLEDAHLKFAHEVAARL